MGLYTPTISYFFTCGKYRSPRNKQHLNGTEFCFNKKNILISNHTTKYSLLNDSHYGTSENRINKRKNQFQSSIQRKALSGNPYDEFESKDKSQYTIKTKVLS